MTSRSDIVDVKNGPLPSTGQRGAVWQPVFTFSGFSVSARRRLDGVRGHAVQRLDFLVPLAAAEFFGGDAPERVALSHGVDLISSRRGFRFLPGKNLVDPARRRDRTRQRSGGICVLRRCPSRRG